jgi:hypothetical protein
VIAGCGGDDAAEDPPDGGGAVPAEASAPITGAHFSQIYPVIFPTSTIARCNFCHSMPASEASNGKLSVGMDAQAAHASLVGRSSASSRCMGKPLVTPGHPETSLLLQKLGPTPPCGSRMPVGGAALSDAQMELIRSWIAAGALND